jgi:hypothetical protein
MPGLVGVTLRRGSILASFRGTITHRESLTVDAVEPGSIHLKLFNLMIKELGPLFLKRGILIDSSVLTTFLDRHPDFLRKECKTVFLNGKPLDPDLPMSELLSRKSQVFLSVDY